MYASVWGPFTPARLTTIVLTDSPLFLVAKSSATYTCFYSTQHRGTDTARKLSDQLRRANSNKFSCASLRAFGTWLCRTQFSDQKLCRCMHIDR
jgi:hypothetical protein